jgi:WD repeat-containing protein 35
VPTAEPAHKITAIAANDEYLFIGRQSGEIMRFTLPHLSMDNRYELKSAPQQLEVNCNSSKLAVIDANGLLTMLDLAGGPGQPVRIQFPSDKGGAREARDPVVWDFKYVHILRAVHSNPLPDLSLQL